MVKISRKYKRRKISKEAMIVAIAICIGLMVVVVVDSINSIRKNNEDNNITESNKAELSQYYVNNKLISDKGIFEKYECEFISKENSQNYIIIRLLFAKNLYDDNNNSNQKYFEGIISELVDYYENEYNLLLVDEEKQIQIEIILNSSNTYIYKINSIEDYFEIADKNNESIKNYKEIETKQTYLDYPDFKTFSNNNWKINGTNIPVKEKGDGYLVYDKYKILTDNIYINTIVLNKDFEDEIMEGIKVGDSFDSIIKKLGDPTFKSKKIIGYKMKNVYMFFKENEATIYPNVNYKNEKLEQYIDKYFSGEYNGRRSNFAYDIIHEFSDFSSSIEEQNTLRLVSHLRGIQILVTEDGKIDIKIYNNYNLSEKIKEYIREGKITSELEEDSIYSNELSGIE